MIILLCFLNNIQITEKTLQIRQKSPDLFLVQLVNYFRFPQPSLPFRRLLGENVSVIWVIHANLSPGRLTKPLCGCPVRLHFRHVFTFHLPGFN